MNRHLSQLFVAVGLCFAAVSGAHAQSSNLNNSSTASLLQQQAALTNAMMAQQLAFSQAASNLGHDGGFLDGGRQHSAHRC